MEHASAGAGAPISIIHRCRGVSGCAGQMMAMVEEAGTVVIERKFL
jgi:hypothetical protein